MVVSDRQEDHVFHSLGSLLLGLCEVSPTMERNISGISQDSRNIRPGYLFLACAGQHTHGIKHAREAIDAGAIAVAWEHDALVKPENVVPVFPDAKDVVLISIPHLHKYLGLIADRFYGQPSADLNVIGVTGTDGKTSCCHFITQTLNALEGGGAIIGTMGYGSDLSQLEPISHTTPDAITVHGLMADLLEHGAKSVSMEVSSHALKQCRVNNIRFRSAVFTNLGRDHLDYHGNIESYADAKSQLFNMDSLEVAAINGDDAYGRILLDSVKDNLFAIAFGKTNEIGINGGVQLIDTKQSREGLELKCSYRKKVFNIKNSLLGRFNAMNIVATASVLIGNGYEIDEIAKCLSDLSPVTGRMEPFGISGKTPLVVVDYAHTPGALESVLASLRELTPGKMWCVFGCGGERDSGKRSIMGGIAESLSDFLVVTDDNPRSEDATRIVIDILSGARDPDSIYVKRERSEAIAMAIENTTSNDTVLVAGKGHETWQDVNGVRLPFSDRVCVQNLLSGVD